MRFHPFIAILVCGISAFAAPALTYSTYLRQGFTPNAITADSAGSVYVAGTLVIDAAARESTGLVVKLNPSGSGFLYQRYIGGSVYDAITAIAVDAAGNAYVVGQTASPDFPVTPGGNLGTAPTAMNDQRSFVAKLDPLGNVVYSDLLGGAAASMAQAVAVTSSGQAVVSGTSQGSGFPTSSGAYQVANSMGQPYLVELDPTGIKLTFAATGIGGSALAIDASGNIYIAGSTTRLDYPTTPGAYQTTFPAFYACAGLCQVSYQGPSQYVSKINSTGTKLIYSTAVAGTYDSSNNGLAVDGSGNVYLSGYSTAGYFYTVTQPPPPVGAPGLPVVSASPFLTKLDPLGQKVLFSVPIGGTGVQLDAAGHAYVGGPIGSATQGFVGDYLVGTPAALSNVPSQCLPNSVTIRNSNYLAQVDANSGNVLATQFVEGSNVGLLSIAVTGSKLWMAGTTQAPDVALTPNALTPDFTVPYYGVNLGAGSYIGAVDFSQPQPTAGTPQIACVLDAAGYTPAGPEARYQLLTIMGSGLGPATGVAATDNATTSLGGVSVNFGANQAILLYASSTQINLAVPLVNSLQGSALMEIQVNGVFSAARQIALTYANPHFFLTPAAPFLPLALNPDGSTNSLSNPAPVGSVVSVFVNGLVTNPQITSVPVELFAENGWQVVKISQPTPFVVRVDVNQPGCTFFCGQNLVLLNVDGTPVAPSYGGMIYMK